MNRVLDIFRVDSQGVLWVGVAETLELARARVEDLAAGSPGLYMVVNPQTGSRHMIRTDDQGKTFES